MLLVPALLSAVMPLLFPSASYLFSLSLLAGLAVWVTDSWCQLGLVPALAAILTLMLFIPLIALVFIALSFSSAHVAAAVAVLLITMLLTHVMPPSGPKTEVSA